MSKKAKTIVMILILIAFVGVLIFILLHLGHNTENDSKVTATPVHDSIHTNIEALWCKKCHTRIDSAKQTGMHASLHCEFCHGKAFRHTRNPGKFELQINSAKSVCLNCHDKSNVATSRPKHQIDSLQHHANSTQCITCHNPHSPLLTYAISKFGETKQVTSACELCHDKVNKVKMQGNHRSVGCQTCHGQGTQHVLSPSPKNINKPQSREFCAKCHATGKTSGKVKQIDLKEHNDGMQCVECHIAHNPLEFK